MDDSPEFADEIARVIASLESLVADRGSLARLDQATRRRLLEAAGHLSRPMRAEQRALRKALGKRETAAERAADDALLDATGIRRARREAVFATPPRLPAPLPTPEPTADLRAERKCYVCKRPYRELHAFYDQLCPDCAAINWHKRSQSANLVGRIALVTGARVKIGYQAAIKLLRAGARVVVTTRFPRDAAARYAREVDFLDWADRLDIHGLELSHTPSVELFAAHLRATLPRLDFIVHNACQTVRRPAAYYAHMMELEHAVPASPSTARLLEHWQESSVEAPLPATDELATRSHQARSEPWSAPPAEDSLSPEEAQWMFPDGRLDADLQQVDLRETNSWRLPLHEVSTRELLEVQLVNAIAPFVLNARLKSLMEQSADRDKHVVNVSAMEGQFDRSWKTDKHPHTNMAKAALNMMTRTSAAEWVRSGIHMNAVDTGWITDEDPLELAARKQRVHRFHPPLDIVDGAARILDPIFDGMLTGRHVWGKFLKDYRQVPW